MESNFNIIKDGLQAPADQVQPQASEFTNESLPPTSEQNNPKIEDLKQLQNLLMKKEVKNYFDELEEQDILINTKKLLNTLLINLKNSTSEEDILNQIGEFTNISYVSNVLA
jgi:hypothetical protein